MNQRVPTSVLIFCILLLTFSQLKGQNIFLFTIDSCRADRLSCYGYPGRSTPHIDAWARTGTLFERAYSTSAWTAPGLVSLLTGLYPPVHGVNNRDHMGAPNLVTLIKLFQEKGYRVPNLNFFTFAPYYRHLGLGPVEREYFGPQPGEELIRWLKRHARPEAEAPFFLWYHTTLLHLPYNPGPEGLPGGLQAKEASEGVQAVLNGAIVPFGSVRFQPEDAAPLNQLYLADLARVDELFGQAIQILRERRLLEQTLVILSADHGEELLDHGFIGHASTSLQAKLYEEVVRIPLILSWPGKIPAGKRLKHPVSQIDLMPTILELFRMPPPGHLQGRSLLEPKTERTLFFESIIAGNQTTKEKEDQWVRAVLRGDWKYISSGELYHLGRDPEERHNLIGEQAQLADSLQVLLEDWLEKSRRLAARSLGSPEVFRFSGRECPRILTPGNGERLRYEVHTGMLLFDWTGDRETTYIIEYDIGEGDHHVAGAYEVQGNHHLLGPFSRELWGNLQAWNPFKIRVSPKAENPCWSAWSVFYF